MFNCLINFDYGLLRPEVVLQRAETVTGVGLSGGPTVTISFHKATVGVTTKD